MNIRFNVFPWAQLRGLVPARPKRGRRLVRVCGIWLWA